jgi:ArsR family transcriptional regulator
MANLIGAEHVLKAVANIKRLQILQHLKRRKELTVEDISSAIHLSYRSTSKHLLLLQRARIINRIQKNRFAYYSISPENPIFISALIKQI